MCHMHCSHRSGACIYVIFLQMAPNRRILWWAWVLYAGTINRGAFLLALTVDHSTFVLEKIIICLFQFVSFRTVTFSESKCWKQWWVFWPQVLPEGCCSGTGKCRCFQVPQCCQTVMWRCQRGMQFFCVCFLTEKGSLQWFELCRTTVHLRSIVWDFFNLVVYNCQVFPIFVLAMKRRRNFKPGWNKKKIENLGSGALISQFNWSWDHNRLCGTDA